MQRILSLLLCFWAVLITSLNAQTYYVDANIGNDLNTGTYEAPFKSINKAVKQANTLTGNGTIVIKLLPGIYVLEDKIDINPVRILSDTSRYIIEADIMPDDQEWSPEKMPVIQSISANNSVTYFAHSLGFLVASDYVTIRGLKFVGNANPMVDYYYPIAKENENLSDLLIAHCIFIGDKEVSKIQGGVYVHGPQNTISHCVFYGCRNAILIFNNADGFTVEHTIVYNSYESAFWLGSEDYQFVFTNNVIVNNSNFLVKPKDTKYSSPFSNSVIANNLGHVGYWSREDKKIVQIPEPDIKLDNIRSSGTVNLNKNMGVKLEKYHLHLKNGSEGFDLDAGIFN